MKFRLAATTAVCAAVVICGGTSLFAQVDPQGQLPQGPSGPGPNGAPQQFGQPQYGPPQAAVPQYGQQPQQVGPPQAGPPQNVPMRRPVPPFELNAQQQADLDQALAAWEKQSAQVKSFKCNFTHWVYDATFVPPDNPTGPMIVSKGELNYVAPDKGLFREDEVTKWQNNPSTRKLELTKLNYGDWWTCDGKSIFQVDQVKQEVHESKLPAEMQGQSITEGPLPFAFGAQAAKLKARYYIRVSTPADVQGQVWLDIYPKLQKDLVNFIRVEVILDSSNMAPMAIRIFRNRNDHEVYQFQQKGLLALPNINLLGNIFHPMPFGYKLIVEQAPGESGPPQGNPQPPNNPQARRPDPAGPRYQ